MTNKNRIAQLEKRQPTKAQDKPLFQSVKNGVTHVHWLSGR
jgi:hypothetical protein